MKIQLLGLFSLILLSSLHQLSAQGIPAREEAKLDQVFATYDLGGEDVVVAIIDRGIDYFHPDFIDEQGNTRLLWIYDMINPEGANAPNNPYGIGTIFSAAEINASLAAGMDTLSTDRFGHGTATTGIAAGNGSAVSSDDFQGVASKARIIAVKTVQDYFPPFNGQPGQNGFYNPTYIPVALEFVADKIAEAGLPGVALMNIGSIGGPTDGTSTICQAMDAFVDAGHVLVCGVGDDGGADNHASASLSQGETLELEIQKGEAGNLRFDLWYSEDDRFQVTLVRPDNTTEGPFEAPSTANAADDHVLGDIYYYHRGANVEFFGATSNRRELLIDFTGATGTYKVLLQGSSIGGNGEFHAVLNPSIHGNSNKFLSHVVAGYSLNDFTSAEKVISPGDYVVKNDWVDMGGNTQQITGQGDPGELWIGSSAGPTQAGEMGIDFVACGEVLHAAYSAGTWYSHYPHLLLQGGDNHYGIQNAVSAAAPLTTGVIALMLEMNPELTPQEVKTILQETASSDGFTGAVPNNQWGYGKINALAAMEAVENTLGFVTLEAQGNNHPVYPNPVADKLWLANVSGPEGSVEKLCIYNLLGEMVHEQHVQAPLNAPVDVSPLPAGLYQLVLSGEEVRRVSTFIKQ